MLQQLIPTKYHYKLANLKRKFIGWDKYSQFGEDQVLLELFKDKSNGLYVDVGAHHPYRYSNTYLLHKKGWHGINIDPDPYAIKLFNKARPHDVNLNCGVGPQEGNMEYYKFSDPAVNTFVEEEAKKWMHKNWVVFLGTEKVPVYTLATILDKYTAGKTIDVLDIDVEGWTLEVLQSNDWDNYRPKVLVVEDDVRSFLESKGYALYKDCGLSHIFLSE